MEKPFTTFAVTRFVNRAAVLESLERCAQRLKASVPGVTVYLFGSFAAGRSTPRSDADIAIITEALKDERAAADIENMATAIFLDALVPVELFVLSKDQYEEGRKIGRGIAGAIARRSLRLT